MSLCSSWLGLWWVGWGCGVIRSVVVVFDVVDRLGGEGETVGRVLYSLGLLEGCYVC